MAVVRTDQYRASVVQLHGMRQVRLAKNMRRRNSGGSKALLHRLNQFRFRQDLAADLNIIETGMQPAFDIVLEGHDAARQPQDHQENRRTHAQPEMDSQNHGSRCHRPRPRPIFSDRTAAVSSSSVTTPSLFRSAWSRRVRNRRPSSFDLSSTEILPSPF